MTSITNHQYRLASRPSGLIKESDFEWEELAVPVIRSGEIRVRNIYLSLDPANRSWMNETETYLPPVAIGEVMRGMTVGVVEESRNRSFKEGDYVQGLLGWQTYAITNGTDIVRLQKDPDVPLTAHLSVLGHIGLTAYIGLLDIGKPQRNEVLGVSAAAGAVGSIAGQIGKMKGCRVVGITGSEKKNSGSRGSLVSMEQLTIRQNLFLNG